MKSEAFNLANTYVVIKNTINNTSASFEGIIPRFVWEQDLLSKYYIDIPNEHFTTPIWAPDHNIIEFNFGVKCTSVDYFNNMSIQQLRSTLANQLRSSLKRVVTIPNILGTINIWAIPPHVMLNTLTNNPIESEILNVGISVEPLIHDQSLNIVLVKVQIFNPLHDEGLAQLLEYHFSGIDAIIEIPNRTEEEGYQEGEDKKDQE